MRAYFLFLALIGLSLAVRNGLAADPAAALAPPITPAKEFPPVQVSLKELAALQEAMRAALVVRREQTPQFTAASKAAVQFGAVVARVPAEAVDLSADKKKIVARNTRKLVKLASLVDKYAREPEAIHETQKFFRQLQTNFRELQAQFPAEWFAR